MKLRIERLGVFRWRGEIQWPPSSPIQRIGIVTPVYSGTRRGVERRARRYVRAEQRRTASMFTVEVGDES